MPLLHWAVSNDLHPADLKTMWQRRNTSSLLPVLCGVAVALTGLVFLACVPDAPGGDPENPIGPGPTRPSDRFEVHLRWDAPVEDADGQPLGDLAGYRLYYAPATSDLDPESPMIETDLNSEAVVGNLPSGAWQFAVTAVDTAGNESDASEIVLVEVGAP